MITSLFFLFIAFIFYKASVKNVYKELIYEAYAFTLGIASFIAFVLFLSDTFNNVNQLFYLIFIPLFFLLFKYIDKKLNNDVSIKANQQRYYQEISSSLVEKFYQNRKIIKKKRVDVEVNEHSKKLFKDGHLVPEFFLNYKNMELTKIENIKQIEENKLYRTIFTKVKSFIDELEVEVDYEKLLKQNDNCLEFFLIELWENYTAKFNIGVAHLDIFAKNEKEMDLIGALDIIHLKSVKRKGAVTFYKYMKFKDRLKEYLVN